jgi:acyl-CoA synthetase (NDP forming)
MYLEGVKDGKRFFSSLRKAALSKPVIVVKGGRGVAGARAAVSHTASLAGSMKIWKTAVAQAGAISAESFEEMIDLAVSFHFLPPIRGRRVGITASGGGPGVLAADQCEEEGLDVISLPTEIREELKARGISIWDWIETRRLVYHPWYIAPSDMLGIMRANRNFDLLVAIMGEPHYVRHRQEITADTYLEPYKISSTGQRPILAIVPEKILGADNHEEVSHRLLGEIRAKLMAANTPVYPSIGRAARAQEN